MTYLRIILPTLLGLFIGLAFGKNWGWDTYQAWLFPTAYFLGLLLVKAFGSL